MEKFFDLAERVMRTIEELKRETRIKDLRYDIKYNPRRPLGWRYFIQIYGETLGGSTLSYGVEYNEGDNTLCGPEGKAESQEEIIEKIRERFTL